MLPAYKLLFEQKRRFFFEMRSYDVCAAEPPTVLFFYKFLRVPSGTRNLVGFFRCHRDVFDGDTRDDSHKEGPG